MTILLLPQTLDCATPSLPTRRASLSRRSSSRVSATKKLRHPQLGEPRVIRVSDPVRHGIDVHHLAVSSPPTPTTPCLEGSRDGSGGEEAGDRQRYYVNLGYAIRSLREELPVLFHRDPSFDIYRGDIVFKDPLNTFAGIENYRRIFWALRFNGRILFKSLWIDIVSVWQPAENVIMLRWTVHGIPRVPWESHGRFDGTSEYKLDKEGKIYEHRVDNVAINSPPKFRVVPVDELILSLGCPNTARPTYFMTLLSSSSLVPYMPYLVNFSWVRYYLAFNLTLVWKCLADGR